MIVEAKTFGTVEECTLWLNSLIEEYELNHFQIVNEPDTYYVVAMYTDWRRK